MVPVPYFEVVSRKDSISTVPLHAAGTAASSTSALTTLSTITDPSEPSSNHATNLTAQSSYNSNASKNSASNGSVSRGGQAPQLYGVVLYDFVAERSDELQANAGESIIIIAKSNEEWFVAKPIGRLGGPGLIPVAFIEVRDIGSNKPVENLEEAIRNANVPRVEEWKRQAAEYKASSIPLGKFDDVPTTSNTPTVSEQLKNIQLNEYEQQQQQKYYNDDQEVYVTKASVERYAYDNDRYWYLVVAKLSNGRFRNLCRYYQDFYDFQINLLEEFPDEAGRTGKPRTLPFMPGPLTYVNDSISSQRRANLDDYVRNLTLMPDYISRSPIVQQLFAIRVGDVETSDPASALPQPPNRNDAPAEPSTQQSSDQSQTSSQQLDQPPESPKSSRSNRSQPPAEEPYEDMDETVTSTGGSTIHAASPSSASAALPAPAAADTTTTTAAPEKWAKIKVFHEDDLIALRVPTTISFATLRAKVVERLGIPDMTLLFKDELTGQLSELKDEADFTAVLGEKQKLVLCAK